MIVTLLKNLDFLRVAACIILIMFAGCRIILPAIINAREITKTVSLAAESNDDDKSAETKLQLAFFNTTNDHVTHPTWYHIITHFTAYSDNYQSSYYQKISIPPPDILTTINS